MICEKAYANLPFKLNAALFNRDPIMNQGMRGLEKRIGENGSIAAMITILREIVKKKEKILI